jgi:hypothetical protein
MRFRLALAVLVFVALRTMCTNAQADGYPQGVADWQSLQAWFQTQSGDRRAGADFWATNRSKAGHKSCEEAGGDFSGDKSAFIAGCREAKQRLDPIDAKRFSDPEYRAGFNYGTAQVPLSAGTAPSAASPKPPTTGVSFPAYPLSGPVYVGVHAPPDLSAPDNYLFRTRITSASQENPNFAGRYVISVWGCGTGCAQGVAVNVATGKVVWLPGSFVFEPLDAERYEFRLDSRLLIVRGHDSENDETPYAPRCYVLDEEYSLRFVKKLCDGTVPINQAPAVSAPPVRSSQDRSGFIPNTTSDCTNPDWANNHLECHAAVVPPQPRETRSHDLDRDLVQCLWPEAQYGKYSSFDGGKSAGELLSKCGEQWSAWMKECQSSGQTEERCVTQSAIIAQVAIKQFGK